MEGLLIAEELIKLTAVLPSNTQGWRFPDNYTFVLPLKKGAIWLYNRPPNPRIAYEQNWPSLEKPRSGFQEMLASKAIGDLIEVEQVKLDRVIKFYFAPVEEFIKTHSVTLVAELTGRNCNLILINTDEKILGAARFVSSEMNRHRQVYPGVSYTSPPPYKKLDPRTATDEILEKALLGQKPKHLRKLLDGVGPDLTLTLVTKLGLNADQKLEHRELAKLIAGLRELSQHPNKIMKEVLGLPDVKTLREQEARFVKIDDLKEVLSKKQILLEKRLKDIKRTYQAAEETDNLRDQAALLLAHQKEIPAKVATFMLKDFNGDLHTLTLNSKLNAVENAQTMFERAKKLERRADQAQVREGDLITELAKLKETITSLDKLSLKEIDQLSKTYANKPKEQFRAEPFMRYQSPQGYNVLVGRNSKGNDHITFRLARSQDVWLHVQGYTGSHAIIQATKKEVPFETILFAAELAAAYSKAGASDNVPVDYTLKKNVWKVKGIPLGAVHFSQQKTVYVTPNRHSK